jgi:hypothetical protein
MALIGSGTLGPGQAEYVDLVLQSGVTYAVFVDASDPSVDFDLYVYDENGGLVAQDTATDSDALCYITPRWTGPFRLVVKSARGISTYTVSVHA